MRKLTNFRIMVFFLLIFPLLLKAQISGDLTIGVDGDYSTLGEFANSLNLLGMSGNTNISIISDIEEINPVIINQWTETGGLNYYLTIKPTGENRIIQGNFPASAVIVLNGADRVIIDGELNEGERNLTIKNNATNGTNAAIWIKSLGNAAGCKDITIKNTNIFGANAGVEVSTTFGIYVAGTSISTNNTGADNDNLIIENNNIKRAYYGIFIRGASATVLNDSIQIINNQIGSDIETDYVFYRGIDVRYCNALLISQNHIFNLKLSTGSNIAAIDIGSDCSNTIIERNLIHSLSQSSAAGYGCYGINTNSATGNTNISIINNVIYDITTVNYGATNTTRNPFGIRLSGGTNIKLWFNSVNLNGTQAEFGTNGTLSAALLVNLATVTGLDVRNNVFSNSLAGLAGSASYAVCVIGSASSFVNLNHNNYYAGGNYGVLGHIGVSYSLTNQKFNLNEWQTATGFDNYSLAEIPQFTNENNLLPVFSSPLVLSGEYLDVVPNDITGTTRAATPTIGAYEFIVEGEMNYASSIASHPTFKPVMIGIDDQVIIKINIMTEGIDDAKSVTGFSFNSNGTSNQSDITNAKLFYTGRDNNFSNNNQFGNTITDISAPFSIVGNQILLPGNNYFWLTYSISPTATEYNDIDAECTLLTCNGNNYIPEVTAPAGSRTIRNYMQGVYTVGSGGLYQNLNEAFSDIQMLGVSGDVVLNIVSNIAEPSPAVLNQWLEYGEGNYYVTIKADVTDKTIQGEFADNGVIVLNGADRVIIDGEAVEGERNLQIINNAASGNNCVIRLIGYVAELGCENVTIKNCIITGANRLNGNSIGIVLGGATLGATQTGCDHNNITIKNNWIKKVYYGINAYASATEYYENLQILNNEIGSEIPDDYIGQIGIQLNNCPGAIIDGNHIYNIGWLTSTSYLYGIQIVSGCSNSSVINNRIHTIWNTSANYGAAIGINSSSSDILIASNAIYDLVTTNYSNSNTGYNPFGIRITGGANIKIIHNSINLYGVQQPSSGYTKGTLSSCIMISVVNASNIQIQNNILSNTLQGLEGSIQSCIYNKGAKAVLTNIDYNDYFNSEITGKVGYINGLWYNSLEDWQAETLLDNNSMLTNPMFTEENNLMPLPVSPLYCSGISIEGFETDILGNARRNPPTIGAYEIDFGNSLAPPLLVFPLNYSFGVPRLAEFSWSEVENASSYLIQISSDIDFLNIIFEQSVTLNSHILNNELEETTQYYWRVKGEAYEVTAYWSKIWSFITQGTLAQPVLSLPGNGSEGLTPDIPLIWQSVFGANQFNIQIASDLEFTEILVDTLTNQILYLPTTLAAECNYYWRVRASNGVDNSVWSDIWSFSTGYNVILGNGTNYNSTTIYPAPYGRRYKGARHQILVTADEFSANGGLPGLITNLSFKIHSINNCDAMNDFSIKLKHTTQDVLTAFEFDNWTTCFIASPSYVPVVGWNNHQFDVPFEWDGISNILIETCFNNYPQAVAQNASHYYTTTPVNTVGCYYSDTDSLVCSSNSVFNEIYSANRPNIRLTMDISEILPPLLISPQNNYFEISRQPEFHWNYVSDAASYYIEIATDIEFTNTIISQSVPDNYFILSNPLNALTQYFWRVKGENDSIYCYWSQIWNFITKELVDVPWQIIETNNSSTIIIPTSINPMLGDRPFTSGDAIGLFYQNDENEWQCGGYGIWNGQNLGITVWGDNDTTQIKDGFAIDEIYTFKVWDAVLGQEWNATATYQEGTDNYQISGFSVLTSLNVYIPTEQNISLNSGWNIISSYIIPENDTIPNVFSNIVSNLKIVKNGAGDIYDPAFGINNIGNWNFSNGYLVNMLNDNELIITGQKLIPEVSPINLNNGWNLSAYLRDNEMSPTAALTSISSSLVLAKDNVGGIYSPAYGVNTLGNMQAGQGYYFYMNAAAELTYPANSAQKAVTGNEITPLAKYNIPTMKNTGSNATLLVSIENNEGNEIGVYNMNNELIGSGAVYNGIAAITIWGDDEATQNIDGAKDNEYLNVKIDNTTNNTTKEISLSQIKEISGNSEQNQLYYKTNSIYVAKASANDESGFAMSIKNIPNPVESNVVFEFGLTEESNAEIQIYTSTGELVASIGNKVYSAGLHRINFDASNLASGMYNIVLSSGNKKVTSFMIVNK